MDDPLPAAYYYFFWLVEPILTLAGAAYAIVWPEAYGAALLPAGLEARTAGVGGSVRGRMVVGCLGSCFLLLALISLSLFPVIRALPRAHQGGVARALLVPLAIADLVHIALTLLPLPAALAADPRRWTGLIYGNVAITAGLFAVRTAYLLGVGRRGAHLAPARAASAASTASTTSTTSTASAAPPTPRRSARPRKSAAQAEVERAVRG